jgi:hypothetical protein
LSARRRRGKQFHPFSEKKKTKQIKYDEPEPTGRGYFLAGSNALGKGEEKKGKIKIKRNEIKNRWNELARALRVYCYRVFRSVAEHLTIYNTPNAVR